MSQQLNNSSSRGANSFSGDSFLDAFAQFLEIVKRETKDIFELLNYPCVYQNPKKRIGVDDIPMLKKVSSLNIVSVKDKIHVDKFLEKKKQLVRIFEHVKNYSKKYKMNTSLVSMCELLITFHLVIEFKIRGIISTLREHNIMVPQFQSNLPVTLDPYIELRAENEHGTFVQSFANLSGNSTKLISLLKSGNAVVNLLNMDIHKKDIVFTSTRSDYHFENSNSSENSNSFFSQSKEKMLVKSVDREGTEGMTEMGIVVERNVEIERPGQWGRKMEVGNEWKKEQVREDERPITRGNESEKKRELERQMIKGRKSEWQTKKGGEVECFTDKERENESQRKTAREEGKQREMERQMVKGRESECYIDKKRKSENEMKTGKEKKQMMMRKEEEWRRGRGRESENGSPMKKRRDSGRQREVEEQIRLKRIKRASLVLDNDDENEHDINFRKKGESFQEYRNEEQNRSERKTAIDDKVLEYEKGTIVDLGLSPETELLLKLLMNNRKFGDTCVSKNRNFDL